MCVFFFFFCAIPDEIGEYNAICDADCTDDEDDTDDFDDLFN